MKELLYYWTSTTFEILVPKKRGCGFLKVPYGHHVDQQLDEIGDAVGCDITGLDGSLTFWVTNSIHSHAISRAKFIEMVMPLMERHYGFPYRAATNDEIIHALE